MSQGPIPSATAAEPRRIALWAVPRSVSTAFERVFIERDDAEVLHEPFSHAYYHGPERQSDRFEAVKPQPEHAYEAVMAEALAARETPVLFMKDMAYQVRPIEDPRFFAEFTNTFLIREPQETLLSLHRIWPDFTFEEAGFVEQAQLFELVTDALAQPAVVVDATDFRRDPERTMAAYCAAVGIEHREDALSWEAGAVPEWQNWADWHREAEQSSGILPPAPDGAADQLPAHVQAMVEMCRPHYQRLHAERLAV
jgi:hypothetical protein